MVLGVSPVEVGGAAATQHPHNKRQQRAATSQLARHGHTREELSPESTFLQGCFPKTATRFPTLRESYVTPRNTQASSLNSKKQLIAVTMLRGECELCQSDLYENPFDLKSFSRSERRMNHRINKWRDGAARRRQPARSGILPRLSGGARPRRLSHSLLPTAGRAAPCELL